MPFVGPSCPPPRFSNKKFKWKAKYSKVEIYIYLLTNCYFVKIVYGSVFGLSGLII